MQRPLGVLALRGVERGILIAEPQHQHIAVQFAVADHPVDALPQAGRQRTLRRAACAHPELDRPTGVRAARSGSLCRQRRIERQVREQVDGQGDDRQITADDVAAAGDNIDPGSILTESRRRRAGAQLHTGRRRHRRGQRRPALHGRVAERGQEPGHAPVGADHRERVDHCATVRRGAADHHPPCGHELDHLGGQAEPGQICGEGLPAGGAGRRVGGEGGQSAVELAELLERHGQRVAQDAAGAPAADARRTPGAHVDAVAGELGRRQLMLRREPRSADLHRRAVAGERPRPGAAADAVARLKQRHLDARLGEVARGPQAGEPRADHDHPRHVHERLPCPDHEEVPE